MTKSKGKPFLLSKNFPWLKNLCTSPRKFGASSFSCNNNFFYRDSKKEREMHLWPSLRIRDSFKMGYLKKLDHNMNRMNSGKEESATTNKQNLLEKKDSTGKEGGSDSKISKGFLLCRELLMLLSCCYCCFCCGACIDQEEEN